MITKNVNGNDISQAFIDQIRSDSPNVLAKLMLNSSELACDIARLQVTKGSCGSTELTLGNVVADMLTASVKDLSTQIKGEDLECYIGAWTGADYEFISLGVFTVTEARKTRYTTEITAYSSVVGKTSDLYVGDNSAPNIAELGNNIATFLGCTITFDPAIDTTQIVHADVLNATIYQCLQAIAVCSGGYVVNDNAGNILVKKYDSTPTLSVDTGMMVKLPEVDEAIVEVRSVKCNGQYPYSAQIAFLADEQDRNIIDQSQNLIFGYDTADNADVQFNCDYMTDEVFNANIVGIIGYAYWHATVGLTLGDPRLEGMDVLAVEDVDGTIYNVPCHQITHRYSGGFASDIRSAQPTQQQVDIGSVSPIGASMELAFQASQNVKRMGQYFWFVGDGNDAGAHITEKPKDDFISDPTGGNLLATSQGLNVRDGLEDLAKFNGDNIQIGKDEESQAVISPKSFKMVDGEGNAYVEFLDQTNAEGHLVVEKKATKTSATLTFDTAPYIYASLESALLSCGGRSLGISDTAISRSETKSTTSSGYRRLYTTFYEGANYGRYYYPPQGSEVVINYTINGASHQKTYTADGDTRSFDAISETDRVPTTASTNIVSVSISGDPIYYIGIGTNAVSDALYVTVYDTLFAPTGATVVFEYVIGEDAKAYTLGYREEGSTIGQFSFAFGKGLIASNPFETAFGRNSYHKSSDFFTISNGTDESPQTLFRVTRSGSVWVGGISEEDKEWYDAIGISNSLINGEYLEVDLTDMIWDIADHGFPVQTYIYLSGISLTSQSGAYCAEITDYIEDVLGTNITRDGILHIEVWEDESTYTPALHFTQYERRWYMVSPVSATFTGRIRIIHLMNTPHLYYWMPNPT